MNCSHVVQRRYIVICSFSHAFFFCPNHTNAHKFLNEANSTHIQYKLICYYMIHYISFALSVDAGEISSFCCDSALSFYLHLPFSSNDKFMYNKHT